MTQFVIVRGCPGAACPPPGIGVRGVEPSEFIANVLSSLFPGEDSARFFAVFDLHSGEADAIFDAMHESISANSPPSELPFIRFLRRLAEERASIVCWYGDDWEELPIFSDWDSFQRAIVADVEQQPAEVYAHLTKRDLTEVGEL